jgi:hypothetical protein
MKQQHNFNTKIQGIMFLLVMLVCGCAPKYENDLQPDLNIFVNPICFDIENIDESLLN